MTASDTAFQATWASTREHGTLFLMRVMYIGLKLLPRWLMAPFVHLATLYFLVCGRSARRASLDYLRRVERLVPQTGLRPRWRCVYRHFTAFAYAILDKLDAWAGRLEYHDVIFDDHGALRAIVDSGRGVLVIGSHLGNLEVCRALAVLNDRVRLNVLVHTAHAHRFNRILAMAGASAVELIQVTRLDAGIALRLKQRIDRGEWVVIAGDRVPVHGGRTVDVRFFGGAASFPIGPYVLGALLECPVHLLFCLRRGTRNHIFFEPFAALVRWRRAERDTVIAASAQRFAVRLEHYLRLEPLQWFNFYHFWHRETGDEHAL